MREKTTADICYGAMNQIAKFQAQQIDEIIASKIPQPEKEKALYNATKTLHLIMKVDVLMAKNQQDLEFFYNSRRQNEKDDGLYIVRLDCVFDIVFLQDIFMKAMERFKDKLYLLGNFTMSDNFRHLQIGKQVLKEYFAKYRPEKLSEDSCIEGIFADKPLPDDEKNCKLFLKIVQEMDIEYLKKIEESRKDSGEYDDEYANEETQTWVGKEIARLVKMVAEGEIVGSECEEVKEIDS